MCESSSHQESSVHIVPKGHFATQDWTEAGAIKWRACFYIARKKCYSFELGFDLVKSCMVRSIVESALLLHSAEFTVPIVALIIEQYRIRFKIALSSELLLPEVLSKSSHESALELSQESLHVYAIFLRKYWQVKLEINKVLILIGQWALTGSPYSRKIQIKSKLVCENTATKIQGSWTLQVMGS